MNTLRRTKIDIWGLMEFYTINILPLVALMVFASQLESWVFISLFAIYCLVYRPLSSGLRLLDLRLITGSQFWKVFIPLWEKRYFKLLYLGYRPVD